MTCKVVGREPINICPMCLSAAYRHAQGATARDRVISVYTYALHDAGLDYHPCQYEACECSCRRTG